MLTQVSTKTGKAQYVSDQSAKSVRLNLEDQPTVDIDAMLSRWFGSCQVYRKYAYKREYVLGQQIETLANMLLYDYARVHRIELLTVHDAAFCPADRVDEIQGKQLEFLRFAAEVFRRLDHIIKHRKKEKRTSKTKKKYAQGMEWVLEGLPEEIALAYKAIFNTRLSQTRYSGPRKKKAEKAE